MKKLFWILAIAAGVCFVAYVLPKMIKQEEIKKEEGNSEFQEEVRKRTVTPMEKARKFGDEANTRSADRIKEIEDEQ